MAAPPATATPLRRIVDEITGRPPELSVEPGGSLGRTHSAGRASDGSPLTPDPYASAYVASWQGFRCASTITIRSRLRRRIVAFCVTVTKSGGSADPRTLGPAACVRRVAAEPSVRERWVWRLPAGLRPQTGGSGGRWGPGGAPGHELHREHRLLGYRGAGEHLQHQRGSGRALL